MKLTKELYDETLRLMTDCNETLSPEFPKNLETMNTLLTGVLVNLNEILTLQIKKPGVEFDIKTKDANH